jgi:hypothetical protein
MTEVLRRYWPIITGVILAAMAWGAFGSTLSATRDQVESNSERIRTLEQIIPEFRTDLLWIKQALGWTGNE